MAILHSGYAHPTSLGKQAQCHTSMRAAREASDVMPPDTPPAAELYLAIHAERSCQATARYQGSCTHAHTSLSPTQGHVYSRLHARWRYCIQATRLIRRRPH